MTHPKWTMAPKYDLMGCGEPWRIRWGKTIRLKVDEPTTLRVVNRIGIWAAFAIAALIFLFALFAGASAGGGLSGFILGAFFSLPVLALGIYGSRTIVFSVKPGKRYRLSWKDGAGLYRLTAQEVQG